MKIGRLALRVEGKSWVAYYAMPNTMKGALFLGSIRMSIVDSSLQRKQDFMNMMRDIVGDIIERECGTRPTWGGEEAAPEHERAGSA